MNFPIMTDEFFQNPYPSYERMRAIHPLYKHASGKYPGWYVTGYEEALNILKDARFQNRSPLPPTASKYEGLKNSQNHMMLFKNPPEHTRLRTLVGQAFSQRAIEKYRTFIEETAHTLLKDSKKTGKLDVVTDFAFPLASLVIAKILGIPEKDRQAFRDWAFILIQGIDLTRTRFVLTEANDTIVRLSSYFREFIQERKQRPQDDLVSLLTQTSETENGLTDDEIISTCILLLIAGHETTVNLLSNAMVGLLHHPDQLAALKANPSLIETAVEEFLRYESPTQMTARMASEDIELNGCLIQKGEQVYVLLGAANRDPRKFLNPEKLDITRNPNPHLAFGYGTHFCLGSTLARMEARLALPALLNEIPNFELDSKNLPWRNLVGFRSLENLPIIFK
ncbi:cytochrome P450 [Ammoniphilus sp. 3BR4]|uniref:cytochrome P450 n=1 Tax=Ammoniphilus sp. 3BR4 TaxID=3158265 RepID=UPI003464F499